MNGRAELRIRCAKHDVETALDFPDIFLKVLYLRPIPSPDVGSGDWNFGVLADICDLLDDGSQFI